MAWEKVLCSCGHYSDIQVFGKAAEREKKIQWFKDAGLCKNCYKQYIENQKALTNEVVEMDYRNQYKVMFDWCDKVRDSYNKEKKTIKVYIPKKMVDFAKAFMAGDKIAQFEAIAKMQEEDVDVQKIIERVPAEFIKEGQAYFAEKNAKLEEK